MQKITPCLWFNDDAEDAVNLYTAIFKNSRINHIARMARRAHLWKKLSAGGQKSQCGWLKDKFGLSWQIVPNELVEMLQDKDAEKSQRVMQAPLQMTKLDSAALRRAFDGEQKA
ncbi:MAG: hypothetical protein FJ143_09540 [Deltaproteobacteria bacterium]|nr:hypothetical protein [Deltaproteobacteria bacterium]